MRSLCGETKVGEALVVSLATISKIGFQVASDSTVSLGGGSVSDTRGCAWPREDPSDDGLGSKTADRY